MCYTSNCSVKFSQIQDRHSWITDVAQFIFTRSQKCSWKVENTHLHNTRTLVLWDKLCHCQPWLFHSQKTLCLLGVQETEAVSYWSEQCDMKLLLPELKHSVVNTSWAACWLDQRCSASVKLTLQHIHGSQLTNETESRRWRANHTILKCSNTLLCHGPAPLLLWQKVDWIALDFFFFSTTCQICISGARPGGIRFKKDSLHSQKLISSSIPALGAPQPAARDRGVSELWPLESSPSLTVYLTSRSIYSEDQLSLPSVSRSFKWARRPGRRFGDGLNSIF